MQNGQQNGTQETAGKKNELAATETGNEALSRCLERQRQAYKDFLEQIKSSSQPTNREQVEDEDEEVEDDELPEEEPIEEEINDLGRNCENLQLQQEDHNMECDESDDGDFVAVNHEDCQAHQD